MIKLGRQVFPRLLSNTLVYSEAITFPIASGLGKFLMRANGMFDPNYTYTGHKPLYYDQLAAIYNHWIVMRSRIKISFATNSATTAACTATVYLDDDPTFVSDAVSAAERPGAHSRTTKPSADGAIVVWNSYDATKIFGQGILSTDNLHGSVAADPAEQSYYACSFFDHSLGSYDCIAMVEMQFDCVWDELRTIAAS